MPVLTLTSLVPWVIAHGYFIFYLAAVIEGPLVTTAAGVAAGLGYYSAIIIILIAIAGDLTADIVYYFVGYYGRSLVIENHGYRLGLTKERLEKIDNMAHKHFRKTMLLVKLSPIIPVPGLIAIGASHVSLRKFVEMSLLITVPKAIFFTLLGFYSGKTYMYLTNTVNNSSYIAGALALFVIIIYFIYQKTTANIAKKANLK